MTRLSCLLLFCYIFHGYALGLTPQEAIKKAEDGLLNAKTLESEFRLTIAWKLRDTVEEKNGKIFIQNPDKYRVEIGGALFISDGEAFYHYSARSQQLTINRAQDMGSECMPGAWLFRYSAQYRPLTMEEAVLDKENCLCITLTPKDSDNRFPRFKVWITGETCSVRKIETTDRNDNIASYLILSLVRNRKFPPSLFAFKPPKGTEVIDMRE